MKFTSNYSVVHASKIRRKVASSADNEKAGKLADFLKYDVGPIVITRNAAPPTVIPMRPTVGPKPHGGLWFAEGGAWAQWLVYEMPHWAHDYIFELALGSNIFEPRSSRELAQFIKTFGNRDPHGRGYKEFVDWSEVAQKYAGFSLCNSEGFFDHQDPFMDPWEVPSGVVWSAQGLAGSRMIGHYDHELKDYRPGAPTSVSEPISEYQSHEAYQEV